MKCETSLERLLSGMRPVLHAEEYGYGQLAPDTPLPAGLVPFATVAEEEGLTIVAPVADLVRHDIRHEAGWARISLSVHSDLSAVGLTAAFASALAREGISANVVAGLFHDHLFLQWDRRDDAMAALVALSHD
ncbi:ACT domain-containing protein [Frigidibacter sp. RF13]|uniref:ACT domain-containing protein n=1 Tax=Frigidibacter sp. RF13 TaxID=2997340 RepID=UPI00226F1BAC|nr:ACT domain-containing protein [Frigidibacter sp. RF13]MCY1127326.1 ACT domain-containing protein [Frigidibacter sp. RF13]